MAGIASSQVGSGTGGAVAPPRVAARFASVPVCACLVIASISGLVMTGWVFNVERLKTVLNPNAVAMNPFTAVLFLLCAAALWRRSNRGNPRADYRVAGTVSAVVAAGAALCLLWQLGGWDSHIDEWMFWGQLVVRDQHNRMAPNTAVNFLLMGGALLFLDAQASPGHRPAQLLTLVALGISLLALVGYLLGFLELYRVPQQVPMALNTTICFVALCVGTLCTRLEREPMATIASGTAGGITARRLLPAAFLVPLLLGWLRVRGASAGLFSQQMGLSLFALGNIIAFNVLVWWNARSLYRMDERRRRAEDQLHFKNQLLEETVRSERQIHGALKEAQSQLVQSEKLAGLGQMVAGVAHEINNPLAYVSNNLAVLQRDVAAVGDLLVQHQELLRYAEAVLQQNHAGLLAALRDACDRVDLPYTLENLPHLTRSSREGLKRIQQIVKDLRNFARLDESDLHEVDLNEGIRSTAGIMNSRADGKGVRIELHLGPLPPVACFPAKVNQMVMSLLANAIDASPAGQTVSIHTTAEAPGVRIDVADQGRGIDPSIRDRIFDPFFTTKPVGQGSGLGLSISYGVVKEHGGTIDVESALGKGSRFIVRLPVGTPRI